MRLLFLLCALFIISNAEAGPTTESDLWVRLAGLPEFDPKKHSDGCSGGMSAGYAILPKQVHDTLGETLPWRECCVIHDRSYYYGGSRDEKAAADEDLKQCVKKNIHGKIAGELLGELMRLAVTPGGSPLFNTPWRWGFGEDYRQK